MKSAGTIEAGTGLWFSPNEGATNSSGFSGLPGGYRYYDGYYDYMGYLGDWWSIFQFDFSFAWYRELDYGTTFVSRYFTSVNVAQAGWGVRCLRD